VVVEGVFCKNVKVVFVGCPPTSLCASSSMVAVNQLVDDAVVVVPIPSLRVSPWSWIV